MLEHVTTTTSTTHPEPRNTPRPRKPGRSRRTAVPWAVLGLWIVLLALVVPFAGKLGDVQQDRAVDYLPAGADSTQVAKIQDSLPGGETTELVLVYHRDGGLTAADRTTAEDQVREIGAAHDLAATPEGIPSQDGATLMYPVATNAPGQDEEARAAFVKDVRATATGTDGLGVEVGGSGAIQFDAEEVYGSLGGPLFLTTVGVVALMLIVIYRSPFLLLIPLISAGMAEVLARAGAYGLNRLFDTPVTTQSASIMTVLVFGVGTDYALLLVARYREELRRVEHPYDAMTAALRGCGPAVIASSGTVAVGLLSLLVADLNSSSGMGPLGALGVLCALLAMVTLLPALLLLFGRRVFWPLIPAYGSAPKGRRSLFAAMGGSAGRHPYRALIGGAAVLGALALGVFAMPGTLKQEDSFTDRPESIAALETLGEAFPERGSQPITVITPTGRAAVTLTTAERVPGVQAVERGRSADGWTELSVIASAKPESAAETRTIGELRSALKDSYVGGPSAQQIDLEKTHSRDSTLVIPLVLVLVLLILIVLLRSLVAPLLLIAAVVAVWGASLGIGGLVFGPLFGFEGMDPGLPLLSFVFLVALGVDYGIFLMHRMREESLAGAEPGPAALSALRSTGAVIASAGLVLAATFGVLLNLPMVMLVQLGFVVAVGVLLDTFLVRTYLVTSASVALGRKVWWPGPLSKPAPVPVADRPAEEPVPVP
ncbi:MMPL family transporter [Streptomyces uncialis]|uniref:MMPL family transporter n=1 Tax=Streptomyces uncialis TaxID=1048205 RepID=UPI00380ECBCC